MKATLIYGAGDVRVEEVPDPKVENPTDAVVRITHSCICGSDLWPYKSREATEQGGRIGHEFIGVVEETGSEVSRIQRGDLVVAPFFYADGTCEYCRAGLTSACPNGNAWGADTDGAQGEAARVPFADASLMKLTVPHDSELMPSLLTLSDVFGTGHHAAVSARVGPGKDVVVVGDGAVGLLAVLASKRLGAERIVLMGHHKDRTDLGREFGATDVVAERGEEGEQKVRDLLGTDGVHAAIEAVGYDQSLSTAITVTKPGGYVGIVGVPQSGTIPNAAAKFTKNITIAGGIAPTQANMYELLPDILDGQIEPGKVFNRTVGLDEVPEGYRAMNDREALKVLVRP
ncbi:zinc-binding dehydrogenase [Actinomycetospora sp. TBRC 11914]|uniref:zinc-binding dehydrogenase n=1 Tax=Actinomycetospora sp. TBRC 11914 TaxID=2729387 RepID=UPI00145C3DF7|nr:alcohol dehydrogenase catalytic domain-containing protein [Actinomycetospora sp. TBRC 11914]NMO94007.1 alcohol dehydrogenase catalytic domain-containing protein [Actinomycetospora sp. TBRC 11914]